VIPDGIPPFLGLHWKFLPPQQPSIKDVSTAAPRARVVVMDNAGSQVDDELALLDRLLVASLEAASSPRRDGESAKSAMTRTLAEACKVCRRRGLQPESMIIMLKSTWARLRETRYATRDEAQIALDRAVTACIELYFAEPGSSTERPTAARR